VRDGGERQEGMEEELRKGEWHEGMDEVLRRVGWGRERRGQEDWLEGRRGSEGMAEKIEDTGEQGL
jgi:hypothetical protein